MNMKVNTHLSKNNNIMEILDNMESPYGQNEKIEYLTKILDKLVEIKLNELGKTYFEVVRENKNREVQLKRLGAWNEWLSENNENL